MYTYKFKKVLFFVKILVFSYSSFQKFHTQDCKFVKKNSTKPTKKGNEKYETV